jgi:hypothetical protein
MLSRILFRLAAPTSGLCLMALEGCASTQAARFYVLSARPGGGTVPPVAEEGSPLHTLSIPFIFMYRTCRLGQTVLVS